MQIVKALVLLSLLMVMVLTGCTPCIEEDSNDGVASVQSSACGQVDSVSLSLNLTVMDSFVLWGRGALI